MNVYLTAEELLTVYEMLLKNPSAGQEVLIAKVRAPILAVLEKEQERTEKEMFSAWTNQEAKKIEELAKQNMAVAAGVSKKSSVQQNRNAKK